jgi:hypothetical protein
VNANLSNQITLLGLVAMIFYGVLLATGTVGTDIMPQFIASALIFLSSGRLMRKPAKQRSDEDEKPEQEKKEINWDKMTLLLNWGMSVLIISTMTIWVMKPTDVTFVEALLSLIPEETTYTWVGGIAP